jgi:hypothetical protein
VCILHSGEVHHLKKPSTGQKPGRVRVCIMHRAILAKSIAKKIQSENTIRPKKQRLAMFAEQTKLNKVNS